MVAAMDAVGVDGVHPSRFRLVKPVDPTSSSRRSWNTRYLNRAIADLREAEEVPAYLMQL
jgi:hypothetical protein